MNVANALVLSLESELETGFVARFSASNFFSIVFFFSLKSWLLYLLYSEEHSVVYGVVIISKAAPARLRRQRARA